ncbi:hypothetical protein [Vibrio methylphosphonaticus]|uniref:hypothetical protein n=1 Tax=Vibrio methylphosphonaticus TaxID=2946866 RepID=UPI002029FFAC|nr:hypothetical protein [Vibrio methylphosphonaticus]MCL9775431.1 hypothetical protein [Vibrio methylphosphonaticus]
MIKNRVLLSILCGSMLIAGCNSEEQSNNGPINPPGGNDKLTGVLWELAPQGVSSLSKTSADLPNIYLFSDEGLKYYHDDVEPGNYQIEYSDYVHDEDNKAISFKYYDDDSISEISGTYSVENNVLTIVDGSYGDIIGDDLSDDEAVNDAVYKADNVTENKVGKIEDLLTTSAGELRFAVPSDKVSSGQFTLDATVRLNIDDEVGDNQSDYAYVGLFNGSFTSGKNFGDIVMDNDPAEGGEGRIRYREGNPGFSDEVGKFEFGVPMSIEISWDENYFTFKMTQNEEIIADESVNYAVIAGPIDRFSLRVGSVSKTSRYEFLVDNLEVYSNDLQKVVFSDDFESYSSGQDLTGGNVGGYHSSTIQSSVTTMQGELPVDISQFYSQDGTDMTWQEVLDTGNLSPLGTPTSKGVEGSTITINQEAVETGPYGNRPINSEANNYRIHTVGNTSISPNKFDAWSRWYQEDSNTQIFRLFKDEESVSGSRGLAARIEAFSPDERWAPGEWHEFSARFNVLKAKGCSAQPVKDHYCSLFQAKGNNVDHWSVMLRVHGDGSLWFYPRIGDKIKITDNTIGKPFDMRVRDNGLDYEMYIDEKLVGSGQFERTEEVGFRWGIYVGETEVVDDILVLVTGASME